MSDQYSDKSASAIADVRSQDESPIVLSRLTCPVCHTVNEFETVRPGSYIEEGTDTDFRPLSRRWTNPRYQSVNPLLYFMATCTTCFYTREFNRAFRESALESDLTPACLKQVRLNHLASVADQGGVVRRLGNSLWPESFPLQTAISKLLLGIVNEKLLPSPSNYDLARWYLRVAWLFRELHPHAGADLTSPSAQCRRDLERSLSELSEDLARLRTRVRELSQFLETNAHAAQKHPEDYHGPMQSRQSLQQLAEQADAMEKLLASMRSTLTSPTEQFLGGEASGARETFGEFASYSEFLRSLKLDCPDIPINEEEALSRARSHYKQAFEAQGGIDRGNGAMLTAYLIGELSRRLACFDDAERYLDMARVAAHVAIKANGHDKPRTALARHLAMLAEKQSQSLYQTTFKPE